MTPDDLTATVFRALYKDYRLITLGGHYIVVPANTLVLTGDSLGAIACRYRSLRVRPSLPNSSSGMPSCRNARSSQAPLPCPDGVPEPRVARLGPVLPPSLFEHPAAELSVDDSAQLGEDHRQPDLIARDYRRGLGRARTRRSVRPQELRRSLAGVC
jgi:hypothetical protein